MVDKQVARTGFAALAGLTTGASGVVATIALTIAGVSAWYGLPLGADAKAMVIGDAGDLYVWIFEALVSTVLMLIATVGGAIGLFALIVTILGAFGLVAAAKGG